jgi:hypothetical protein
MFLGGISSYSLDVPGDFSERERDVARGMEMVDELVGEPIPDLAPLPSEPAPALSRMGRHRKLAAVIAACVAPIIYLLYVNRYSVDVPELDQWLRVKLLHGAIHGHLTLGMLWAPYNEARILVVNLIDIVSAVIDHFDVRTLMFFSAGIFILAYWLLLVLFRSYSGKWPGALSILVLGAIWFSLADVQNPLTGIPAPYLVLLFLLAMIWFLSVPTRRRRLFLALAALTAVAACLTALEGFTLWLIGLICLLWNHERVRQKYVEYASWVVAAGITSAVYLFKFNLSTGCVGRIERTCSLHYATHHPVQAFRFFTVLIGNVVPSGYLGAILAPTPKHFTRQEVLGFLVLAAAVFVVVQTLRHRHTVRLPLPLLLIVFAVCYDLIIVVGRSSIGLAAVLNDNRYVLPNLLFPLAIFIYALAHIPRLNLEPGASRWRFALHWSAIAALGIFLVVQVAIATPFGTRNGSLSKQIAAREARALVNLDRYPRSDWGCVLSWALTSNLAEPKLALRAGLPILADARADHLTIFQPGEYHAYRAIGPPPLSAVCTSHIGRFSH